MAERKEENIFGILSLATALIVPVLGIIYGIIALVRKEKAKWMGVVGIIVSAVMSAISIYLYYKSLLPAAV